MNFYFLVTGLSVVLIPLSVTGSQSLMALSLIIGVFLYFRTLASRSPQILDPTSSDPIDHRNISWIQSLVRKWVFEKTGPGAGFASTLGWLLFIWLLLVYLIRSAQFFASEASLFDPRPYHNELTDFFLFLFAALAFYQFQRIYPGARKDRQFESRSPANAIYLVVTAFSIIVVLSGIGAVFSEIRLSKLFTGYGADFHAGNRPQFLFRTVGDLQLYRPIGFMNTRLSYAGILLFAQAVLLHRFWRSLKIHWPGRQPAGDSGENQNIHRARQTVKRVGFTSIWAFLWLSGLILLLMNGSQSGQIGTLISQLIIVFYIFREKFSLIRQRMTGPGTSLAIISGILILGGAYIYFLDFGTHRHTDYMRPLIWKGSLSIFLEHPLLGVGPGNFTDWFHEWIQAFYLEHPRTMYFLEITPDNHAHNDLLHLLVLGGIPAGLLFLALIYHSTKSLIAAMNFSENPESRNLVDLEVAMRSTAPAFFVAGLSQCYFQDDEVVVVFWFFLMAAEALRFVRRAQRARETASI